MLEQNRSKTIEKIDETIKLLQEVEPTKLDPIDIFYCLEKAIDMLTHANGTLKKLERTGII